MDWIKKTPESFSDTNVFHRFGHQWAILSAGTPEKNNGMTVSWGGMGVLWGKPVATVYVRPERYTYQIMEHSNQFTLSFLPEAFRSALNQMGTLSGKNCDKAAAAGLTPIFLDEAPAFSQAETIFVCQKLYHQDLDLIQLTSQPSIARFYQKDGIHRMYIGEILSIYQSQDSFAGKVN